MTKQFATEILDTTLREGEQCYGVFLPVEIKKRIALLLNEIGVDFIEVGHPAAAPSIKDAVAEIVKLNLQSRLIAHARLDHEEIRLVKELGLKWVGLFCGINARSRMRYNLTEQAIFQKCKDAVSYAKELGLFIKFTCEDASRTSLGDVIRFYSHLTEWGVDRLSFADTLGILRPLDIERMHSELSNEIPFKDIHFHFHNDSGYADANAIKAIECGSRCIDTTLSGIGERMGLVPLERVLAFLDNKNRRAYSTAPLLEAVRLLTGCINVDHFRSRRFAHKSGIHINGMIKDPASYERVGSNYGGERMFVLSKLIGRSGLQMMLSRYGFKTDEGNVQFLLEQIKSEEMLETANEEEICRYFTDRGLKKRTRHAVEYKRCFSGW